MKDMKNMREDFIRDGLFSGRTVIPILENPMDLKALKADQDEFGYVTVLIRMDLEEIIHGNIETFNDEVSEKITSVGLVQDIGYEIVGLGRSFNEVIVEVVCQVGHIIAEEDKDRKRGLFGGD